MDESLRKLLLSFQRNEATGSLLYRRVACREKDAHSRAVLERIADDEKEHAEIWRRYTGAEVAPDRMKVCCCDVLCRLFGYTFVVRLLERGEYADAAAYREAGDAAPELPGIIADEERHEEILTELLDEDRLNYVGAMVLGLNDALVELTGTLAGLTFALRDTRLVALAGIITGVSATLSMAASNFQAERAAGNPKAFKASLYTGAAYLVTVVLLVLPYLLFPPQHCAAALGTMLATAILIILCFNYYISVAKALPVWRRFWEMALLSLGVAAISFGIGLLARQLLGIEID